MCSQSGPTAIHGPGHAAETQVGEAHADSVCESPGAGGGRDGSLREQDSLAEGGACSMRQRDIAGEDGTGEHRYKESAEAASAAAPGACAKATCKPGGRALGCSAVTEIPTAEYRPDTGSSPQR